MSVSLDDIWSEPLANSPSPPLARPDAGANRVDDEDEEDNVFRPTKRRRSTLFLEGSDDEDERTARKSPAPTSNSRPDIDSLFNDLEEPSVPRASKSSRPFDLAALRRDAQARAEKEAPPSSLRRYAVQSSSPPRDGLDGEGKDGAFSSRMTSDAGASKKRQIPKLDEERLLGKDGLPALVRVCKDFKPKGKGHELADLNRLFSIYQFWSHKMYPKTQFSDTVNRVEKLCHSKRMHSALLGWRDQVNGTINGKKFAEDVDVDMHSENGDESGDEQRRERDEEDVFGPRRENMASSSYEGSSSRPSSVAPDPPASRPPSSASEQGGDVPMSDDDDPFDIDALLQQEEEMRRANAAVSNAPAAATVKAKGGSAGRDFTFDEDEDAMWAELHDRAFEDAPAPALPSAPAATSVDAPTAKVPETSRVVSNSSSGWEEDDDVWDILDEMEKEQQQIKKTIDVGSQSCDSSSKPGAETVPLALASTSGNGSAMEAGPAVVTPAKSVSSNDDDWDDMYV